MTFNILTEDNEQVNLNVCLYKHQRILMKVMKDLEYNEKFNAPMNPNILLSTNMAIIGDESGTARINTVLNYMKHFKDFPIDKNTDIISSGSISIWKINNSFIKCPWQVITVPSYLIPKWIDKINHVNLDNYHVINNLQSLNTFINNEKNNIKEEKIVLISNKRYNDFMTIFKNYKFKRQVFDEAHSIKIPNCIKANAYFVWFISPNCKRLYYPNGGYDNEKNESIPGISNRGYIYDNFCNLQRCLNNYRKYVFLFSSPNLLSMCKMNSFTIKKILCNNPNNINLNKDIIHEKLTQNKEKEVLEIIGPKLVKVDEFNEISRNTINECPICYNNDNKIFTLTPCCKNKFCLNCICNHHFNSHKCMICRNVFNINDIIVPEIPNFQIKILPDKNNIINELLDDLENNKTLIYTDDIMIINKPYLNLSLTTESKLVKYIKTEQIKQNLLVLMPNNLQDGLKLNHIENLIYIGNDINDNYNAVLNKISSCGDNKHINIFHVRC